MSPCTASRWPVTTGIAGLALHYFGPLSATAALVNYTIDDEYGDSVTGVKPIYSTLWNQGAHCTGCSVSSNDIDASKAYDGTWHLPISEASQSSVSISFTGVAVYVFNIIVETKSSTAAPLTNLTFLLDGEISGSYLHTAASPTPSISYNVPVFASTQLENKTHTLEVRSGTIPEAVMLFDYVLYTSESEDLDPITGLLGTIVSDSSPAPSSTSTFGYTTTTLSSSTTGPAEPTRRPIATTSDHAAPTSSYASDPASQSDLGTVLGSVAGGVVALTLIVGAIFCLRRRRRSSDLGGPDHQRPWWYLEQGGRRFHRGLLSRHVSVTRPDASNTSQTDESSLVFTISRPSHGSRPYSVSSDPFDDRSQTDASSRETYLPPYVAPSRTSDPFNDPQYDEGRSSPSCPPSYASSAHTASEASDMSPFDHCSSPTCSLPPSYKSTSPTSTPVRAPGSGCD